MTTTGTIDLTPTWTGIMPALILVLTHGTEEGREIATEELMRLARKVDGLNESVPTVPVKHVETDHGNTVAEEGRTRCACGCKYWENDRCTDCGKIVPGFEYVTEGTK